LLLCAKSPLLAPVIEMAEMLIAELVLLVSVKGCELLVVPVTWLPNVADEGERVMGGRLVTVKLAELVTLPAVLYTEIGPLCAYEGTVTASCVFGAAGVGAPLAVPRPRQAPPLQRSAERVLTRIPPRTRSREVPRRRDTCSTSWYPPVCCVSAMRRLAPPWARKSDYRRDRAKREREFRRCRLRRTWAWSTESSAVPGKALGSARHGRLSSCDPTR
jgi:hypothetical protein